MSCQSVCMNSPQIICHVWRESFIEDSQPPLMLEKNASKEHIAHGHPAFAQSRLNFDAELNGAFQTNVVNTRFRNSQHCGSRQGASPATLLASEALGCRLASAGGRLRRAYVTLAL